MKVAILGYGLLGRLCALALADKAQLHIFTQEAEHEQETTGWKAAAMLAPIAESTHAPQELVRLGWASMALWPKLLARLDFPVYFQQSGALVLAHRSDANLYKQFQGQIKPEEQRKVKVLERADLAELEPELANHFAQGLLLQNEGHVDNHALYRGIDQHLARRDCEFHWQSCVSGEPVEYANTQLRKKLQSEVDWVLDCRGLGAQSQWPELRGVRGEVMRVHAPDVTISHPVRLMHPRYPLYVVPKPNKQFVLGATEIESEDESPISVRSSLTLLSAAFSLHPGFAEARVLNSYVGLRPTLLDHCPQIRIQGQCISINGLYRHGYLVGPALSHIATRIMQGLPLGGLEEFASTFVSQEQEICV